MSIWRWCWCRCWSGAAPERERERDAFWQANIIFPLSSIKMAGWLDGWFLNGFISHFKIIISVSQEGMARYVMRTKWNISLFVYPVVFWSSPTPHGFIFSCESKQKSFKSLLFRVPRRNSSPFSTRILAASFVRFVRSFRFLSAFGNSCIVFQCLTYYLT